jgi:hypothetical protein
MQASCSSSCKGQKKSINHKHASFLSLLLIVILPNCPFCIMAYTSAITMCGGPDMYLAENNWASYLPLLLSAIIILMIMLNKRGKRTKYALGISAIGAIFIIGVHQLYVNEIFYYVGTTLLFAGIWINSSFMSVFFTIKSLLLSNKAQ